MHNTEMNAEVDITSYPSFCVEGEGLHILSDNGIELLAADAALRPVRCCKFAASPRPCVCVSAYDTTFLCF